MKLELVFYLLIDHSWGFGGKNPQLKSIQQLGEEIQMSDLKMQNCAPSIAVTIWRNMNERHYKKCQYITQTVHSIQK